MKPNAPCRNCTDRCLLCHSTCEKYNDYQKKNNAYKQYITQVKHQAFLDYLHLKRRGEY